MVAATMWDRYRRRGRMDRAPAEGLLERMSSGECLAAEGRLSCSDAVAERMMWRLPRCAARPVRIVPYRHAGAQDTPGYVLVAQPRDQPRDRHRLPPGHDRGADRPCGKATAILLAIQVARRVLRDGGTAVGSPAVLGWSNRNLSGIGGGDLVPTPTGSVQAYDGREVTSGHRELLFAGS